MAASRVVVQLGEVTNSCFVVMPFHPLYEAEYETVIRRAVEDAGLECVRGDEIYARQAIVEDIWCALRSARLVVAELSGRNPNVMYEVGLAHAIGKPIILLTRNEKDVPFDLRALRYIFYNTNNPTWGDELRQDLTNMIKANLANPELAAHLGGIKSETTLPAAPTEPIVSRTTVPHSLHDLTGVWSSTWRTIRLEREHRATLVIPANHGASFTASMTLTYEREAQQTIVQETLLGSVRDSTLFLTGVSYSYVQRGTSSAYNLDSFELKNGKDDRTLVGKVALRYGVRDVTFTRIQDSATSPVKNPTQPSGQGGC